MLIGLPATISNQKSTIGHSLSGDGIRTHEYQLERLTPCCWATPASTRSNHISGCAQSARGSNMHARSATRCHRRCPPRNQTATSANKLVTRLSGGAREGRRQRRTRAPGVQCAGVAVFKRASGSPTWAMRNESCWLRTLVSPASSRPERPGRQAVARPMPPRPLAQLHRPQGLIAQHHRLTRFPLIHACKTPDLSQG